MEYCTLQTPVGVLSLFANGTFLTGLYFGNTTPDGNHTQTPVLQQAITQLQEYFDKKRTIFTIPLQMEGTPFQKQVWQALQTVPYGATATYGQIAAAIGNPKAYRAVGMANNKNPISIIVPCHRIIGHNGSLVGYGGGMDAKRTLLQLEQSTASNA